MATAQNNPLLADWSSQPFSLPPFGAIEAAHFQPAIDVAQAAQLEELRQIVENPDEATFENTIVAYDRSGGLLSKILGVYYNLCGSYAPPELQAVQRELAGPLAAFGAKVTTYPGLFERIEAVYATREGFNTEDRRLIERIHLDFVRQGARFDKATQDRYKEILQELAQLTTKFTQNVLADETDYTIELSEAEMSGCSADIIASAKQNAADRNAADGVYIVTLSRSMVEPFLTYATNSAAREKVFRAFTSRGELSPERDNNQVAKQILKLRIEQATAHGYKTFADYQTSDTMAKTPEAVSELLNRVWAPAKVAANREREALEEYAASIGDSSVVQAWDWRYYSEKVRQLRYDIDEATVKPYFSLDRMTDAVFDVAFHLFGLRFIPRPDIETYHSDVVVYEVRQTTADNEDKLVAIFFHDNFARKFKRGGAWMSAFRTQSRNVDEKGSHVIPVIINNNNFVKGAEGEPTLLSFDDAITLFHEFGHGCHGMLSDVKYNRLAGTAVLRDFVELPSQLMEHWVKERAVLTKHARHYITDEPIPQSLLDKIKAAANFAQGFGTVEYTACALMDQKLHQLDSVDGLDMLAFEKAELANLEMPTGIVMRHRIPHFTHLFASSGYAALYYVYLWAEVLDADAFDAFLESGDVFDSATAKRVRENIYSTGNSVHPMDAYRAFRGRDPVIEPMLKKKGLL
ncbi:hypothetical protein SPRG_02023 [Saprolegnia parasitica CBS 223.65]|uniref:oligopeptidase A n=1 Tax=Saprolegnia parasitica (strain CBS 223.65) TaxID=695850 RepID=A0A067CRW1_SAPPC|nr:hypothetical protein SPRG_02023 [Saprolegnia parasitica CBS 223.65]KDO33213.1 hypothetical protein SPRG_02023 [Saprolegnia parasitica CBS 223.65]|eukprot:XP_012195970.1 hypothetical protein SPRG_02023 [Saprolegnia parasitica CBS 223.65]